MPAPDKRIPDKHLFPSVHRGIVRAAVLALQLAQHPAAKQFSPADTVTLVEEAAAPDRIGDRQQGRGLHYYNAVTPDGRPLPYDELLAGYCNGKGIPAPSPLTMMDSEYRTALALARAGMRTAAMQSLSRAMHFLADICCPPHSCSLTYFSWYAMAHKRYESRAAVMFWHISENVSPGALTDTADEISAAWEWARAAQGKIPFDRFADLLCGGAPLPDGSWKAGTFASIANRIARTGAKELPFVLGDDEEARDRSITRRILLSVRVCAALLGAFDRDLSDLTLPVWSTQKPYWLRSYTLPVALSKEPVFLHFQEDGTVIPETYHGRRLAVSSSGAAVLTGLPGSMTVRFRFSMEPLPVLCAGGDQNRVLIMQSAGIRCIRRPALLKTDWLLKHCMVLLTANPPENVKFLF